MHVHVYVQAHVRSRSALPDKFALLATVASAHSCAAPSEAKPSSPFSGLLTMPMFAPPAKFSRDCARQYLQFESYELKISQKSERDCDGSKNGVKMQNSE